MTVPMAYDDLFFAVIFVHGTHPNDMSITGGRGSQYTLPAGTYDLQLSYDGAQSAHIYLSDGKAWRDISQVLAGPPRQTRRGPLEQISLPGGGRFTVKTTPPQPNGSAGVATVRVIRTPNKI